MTLLQPGRGAQSARPRPDAASILANVESCLRTVATEVESGNQRVSPWLAGGAAGAALWYVEAGRRGLLRQRNDTERWLEIAGFAMPHVSMRAGLWEGITGLAWVHLHVAPSASRPVDEVELVDALSAHVFASRSVDLVAGAAGLIVLATALRSPVERHRLADACIEVLASERVQTGPIRLWASPDPQTGAEAFDLGVAHGAPGIVACLAQALHAGLGGAKGRVLFQEALDSLLGTLATLSAQPYLPHSCGAANGIDRSPPRHGWCYGELGVAGALQSIEKLTEQHCVVGEEFVRRIAMRRTGAGLWSGMGLCHGASGYHLFARLCSDAVASDRTLDLRVWSEIGQAATSDILTKSEDGSEECLVGLLAGAAGIGMAALRSIDPRSSDQAWLALFGMSPPEMKAHHNGSSDL